MYILFSFNIHRGANKFFIPKTRETFISLFTLGYQHGYVGLNKSPFNDIFYYYLI